MSARSRHERSSHSWPSLLLFFAACVTAVSVVDALFLHDFSGTFRSEKTNSLSSRLAQVSSFRSLSQQQQQQQQQGYKTQLLETSTFVASTPSSLLKWQDEVVFSPTCHTTTSPVRQTFLIMGKGDGKKKRKKKTYSSAAQPALTAPQQQQQQPLPQRVSTDINVPVRMQIQYGQMRKAVSKQSGASFRQTKVVRTKYRRTWDEEEIEEKREERKKRGQEPNWDVILNRTATSPLVVVDGYNIIHKWPRLKKHMVKGDPQRARTLLVDDLENLQSIKGWRIEVVFDGTRRSTTGPLGSSGPSGGFSRVTPLDRESKTSVTKHGVRTVFTGVGVEADSYIEARCATAKNVTRGELTGMFMVATDDAMIRLAGQSAGAYCMGAERFVDELKAIKKIVSTRVEAAVAKANGQAMRPEKLRGTHFHNFGRNQILIEDKRNRTKAKAFKEEHDDIELDIELEVDENGIPWWAKVPDPKKFKS